MKKENRETAKYRSATHPTGSICRCGSIISVHSQPHTDFRLLFRSLSVPLSSSRLSARRWTRTRVRRISARWNTVSTCEWHSSAPSLTCCRGTHPLEQAGSVQGYMHQQALRCSLPMCEPWRTVATRLQAVHALSEV